MSFALRFPRLSALVVGALTFLRRAPDSDVVEPSARITPDAHAAAKLARRQADLSYTPTEAAFHRDQRQERRP